eukprot:1392352-Amorphochlora_amoeboformis.AAC.1
MDPDQCLTQARSQRRILSESSEGSRRIVEDAEGTKADIQGMRFSEENVLKILFAQYYDDTLSGSLTTNQNLASNSNCTG